MKGQAHYNPMTLFKALGDELRLAATLLIHRQGELCVCELMAAFEAPQPKVSRHLASLREAGLLETERRGQWVYYYLSPQLPDWMERVLEETAVNNPALIKQPLARLQAMADRPAVQCL
ncbi:MULTISPECIES: metalloregulator ArsR/SmtB family transcription factor [Marinobacter]|jgi:ArsR family transcriptional regulator|nr:MULTISPECIES: metalloregulator ArsR/SmtB family transcription factor [Marinobacter]